VVPADQRLDADHPAPLEIHDGLADDPELGVVERPAQLADRLVGVHRIRPATAVTNPEAGTKTYTRFTRVSAG
jgi:hypothetical protein